MSVCVCVRVLLLVQVLKLTQPDVSTCSLFRQHHAVSFPLPILFINIINIINIIVITIIIVFAVKFSLVISIIANSIIVTTIAIVLVIITSYPSTNAYTHTPTVAHTRDATHISWWRSQT